MKRITVITSLLIMVLFAGKGFSQTSDTPSEIDTLKTPDYWQSILEATVDIVGSALDKDPGQLGKVIQDAISVGEGPVNDADPLEKYNRMMFRFNRRLDEVALRPLAEQYREHTPALVRQGVKNFFSNVGDIGVVANSALQGKYEQAMWDSTRLTINTIAGIGGVIDVATMLDLKKNNEDFGQTFGVWGIPEGPYIVLPVLGPRTVRSAVGTAFDTYLQAEALGAFSEAASGHNAVTEMMALNLINQREQLIGKDRLLEEAAIDPYIFTREAYLSLRRCKVEDCDKIDYLPAPEESASESDARDEIDLLDELE
ncbi:hypothetical protein AB833_17275 [Chromatiales bacterium (ex Bugula neritina AB1)]|nr:hypothetical protein AB833_17275 [Chromatiales bacterium (ex Bugula neritina AB1)]